MLAGLAGVTDPGMTAAIAIRRGTVHDRGFVIDLGRRVADTSVSSLRATLDPLVDTAYERLAEYVWSRDHTMLIATSGEELAGFALALHDLPDEVTLTEQTFLAYMAVEPAFRRAGVGRALLAEVESIAARRGFAYVSLMVTEENAAARALYDEAGFVTERRMMTKAI